MFAWVDVCATTATRPETRNVDFYLYGKHRGNPVIVKTLWSCCGGREVTMTRYNIELRSVSHVATTVEVDKDDLTALRVEVAEFVGELLRDHAAQIWFDEDWQVEATDENGLILFTMHIFASDTAATMPRRRS